MQLKQYEKGNLEFITIESERSIRVKSKTKFLFNGEYYKSEYVAVEYFKSKGYDAFFSENTTWKNMLRVLFKDIFKKFERMAKKKHYKRNFYDNEFFKAYESEINERFDYLMGADLESEVKRHSINDWIKYRILKMCEHIEKDKIMAILYDIIKDYAHNHMGFPDIFVFNDERYFFCEVKTKTDPLKPVQIRKHEVLLNNGFDVCVFGINKMPSWSHEEKVKYFNQDYIDEENYIEFYDYKMKRANEAYERFRDDGIEEIKGKFLEIHGIDMFIGFLNVASRKGSIEMDQEMMVESKMEAEKIRNLRHLSKGMFFEERGLYSEAIEEYDQVETYERFERLNQCYRRKKDGESQVNLIYHVLNEEDDIPYKTKAFFRTTANRLFRNKRSVTTYATDEVCPVCGSPVKLTTLHKRNGISIFTCTKRGCYWYGGVFKGDIRRFSECD